MYTKSLERNVEAICYEEAHIKSVLSEIKVNFEEYFQRFIATHAGMSLSQDQFDRLRQRMGIQNSGRTMLSIPTENYKRIIRESIEKFEHDRDSYEKILNQDALEEFEEDPNAFKTRILGNQCPVIRKTLANRAAKELDKYRQDFRRADADGLLDVVTRLCLFAEDYVTNVYDAKTYEQCDNYQSLQLDLLDTEEYTYFGVIGGGIKTMMLHKINPMVFSNRSRNAVWALWYLSGKKEFGCKMDSEFLMINVKKSIIQQNYYYPYVLFAYYAFEVYKLLRDKATEMQAYIDPAYRYVIVDAFFDYVAMEHQDEIHMFSHQIAEDRGYCCA